MSVSIHMLEKVFLPRKLGFQEKSQHSLVLNKFQRKILERKHTRVKHKNNRNFVLTSK